MQLDRTIYDAEEKQQMDFLAHLFNKTSNQSEKQLFSKVMQTVYSHYMSKRNIIDAHNHNESIRFTPNYDEL